MVRFGAGSFQSTAGTRPLSIELAVRPPRVGVFVPAIEGVAWQRCFDAVLAHHSAAWGGAGDLVFPLQEGLVDHELFWRIADFFDADAYGVDNLSGVDLADIAPAIWEQRFAQLRAAHPDLDEEAIVDFLGRKPLAEALIPHELHEALVRRVAPMHLERGAHDPAQDVWQTGHIPRMAVAELDDLPTEVKNSRTALGPVQSLLLTAELGRFNNAHEKALVQRNVSVVEVAADSPGALADLLYTNSAQEGPRPWRLSLHGLGFYTSLHTSRTPPVIVVGDEVWDFVLFYALRRMRMRAWWLPREVREDPMLSERLHMHVHHFARQMALPAEVSSHSDMPAAEEVAAWLDSGPSRTTAAARDWRLLLPEEPNRLYEVGSEGHPQAVLLHEGQTPALPSPVPATVRHHREWETSWLVEARVDGWVGLRHPRLAAALLAGPNTSAYMQRPTSRGVAYVATGMLVQGGSPLVSSVVRPRLRPRDLLAQVQFIFEGAGWRAERSDKGAYAQRAADIFGGLRPLCEALKRTDLQIVFRTYLSGKREQGAPGRWVASDRRRVLTLDDFVGLLGAGTAEALVDDLRQREALQLGAILKCRRCRQENWYDIEAFGRSFVCPRCRLDQRADAFSWLNIEPVWSYRLDEALVQFLLNRGDLPVAAAGRLIENSREPTDAALELDVWSPPSDQVSTASVRPGDATKSELDILVSDGARLWGGEATSADRLESTIVAEEARLARLHEIVHLLGARHVILANSGAWASRTRTAADAQFPGPWPLLRFEENVPMVPRPKVLLHHVS